MISKEKNFNMRLLSSLLISRGTVSAEDPNTNDAIRLITKGSHGFQDILTSADSSFDLTWPLDWPWTTLKTDWKSVYYKKRDNIDMKLKKIYFIWICPDMKCFEWFTDVLKFLEDRLKIIQEEDLIEARVYLSRGWDEKTRIVSLTVFDLSQSWPSGVMTVMYKTGRSVMEVYDWKSRQLKWRKLGGLSNINWMAQRVKADRPFLIKVTVHYRLRPSTFVHITVQYDSRPSNFGRPSTFILWTWLLLTPTWPFQSNWPSRSNLTYSAQNDLYRFF